MLIIEIALGFLILRYWRYMLLGARHVLQRGVFWCPLAFWLMADSIQRWPTSTRRQKQGRRSHGYSLSI
jgi:hypothetical protein